VASDSPDDFYALLGVDPDIDRAQLRRVWRRIALRWHPDRAGPSTTALFQKLSVAYAVLSDPDTRAAYDRERGPPAKRSSAGDEGTSPPAAPPRGRPSNDMLWRVSGSLKALLARGIARRADDDVLELLLNAQEAAEGGMVTVSLRVAVRCLACRGKAAACVRCGGQGFVYQLFSAWVAVPAGAVDGTILVPPDQIRGMLRPVRFRVRVGAGP
jgi:molecular chaperone DnaJ